MIELKFSQLSAKFPIFKKQVFPLLVAVTLSACGGGGTGGISSAPGPVEPPPQDDAVVETGKVGMVGESLPPTPALTSGTYETIGIASTSDGPGHLIMSRLGTSNVRIAVDASGYSYAIQFDPEVFRGLTGEGEAEGQIDYTIAFVPNVEGEIQETIDRNPYGHVYTVTTSFSDGTEQTEEIRAETGAAFRNPEENGDPKYSDFKSNTGKSYVSLGSWGWSDDGGPRHQVDFAYGERTPPASLPVSGTANYSSTNILNAYGRTDIQLTADFGQRSIAADVRTEEEFGNDYYADYTTVRQHLDGSSSIESEGTFEMTLSGTAEVSPSGSLENSETFDVSGLLGGAFFGSDASQIGGYFVLPVGHPENNNSIVGGFVAVKP